MREITNFLVAKNLMRNAMHTHALAHANILYSRFRRRRCRRHYS